MISSVLDRAHTVVKKLVWRHWGRLLKGEEPDTIPVYSIRWFRCHLLSAHSPTIRSLLASSRAVADSWCTLALTCTTYDRTPFRPWQVLVAPHQPERWFKKFQSEGADPPSTSETTLYLVQHYRGRCSGKSQLSYRCSFGTHRSNPDLGDRTGNQDMLNPFHTQA